MREESVEVKQVSGRSPANLTERRLDLAAELP
jgi:hypothetical protein